VLGDQDYVAQMQEALRGDRKEQAGLKQLKQRPSWDEVIRVVQNFTNDRTALLAAVRKRMPGESQAVDVVSRSQQPTGANQPNERRGAQSGRIRRPFWGRREETRSAGH